MIPDEAVEAAMRAWGVNGNDQRRIVGSILEAAAPHMHVHRVATGADELDALPVGSVVVDAAADVYRKMDRRDGIQWYEPGDELNWGSLELNLPATVIHAPSPYRSQA